MRKTPEANIGAPEDQVSNEGHLLPDHRPAAAGTGDAEYRPPETCHGRGTSVRSNASHGPPTALPAAMCGSPQGPGLVTTDGDDSVFLVDPLMPNTLPLKSPGLVPCAGLGHIFGRGDGNGHVMGERDLLHEAAPYR